MSTSPPSSAPSPSHSFRRRRLLEITAPPPSVTTPTTPVHHITFLRSITIVSLERRISSLSPPTRPTSTAFFVTSTTATPTDLTSLYADRSPSQSFRRHTSPSPSATAACYVDNSSEDRTAEDPDCKPWSPPAIQCGDNVHNPPVTVAARLKTISPSPPTSPYDCSASSAPTSSFSVFTHRMHTSDSTTCRSRRHHLHSSMSPTPPTAPVCSQLPRLPLHPTALPPINSRGRALQQERL